MESEKIKVSVILPVYNPGEGIQRCIDSLTNQTLKDVEFIFVDDCGTDNAISYIKAAAFKDARIRMIHNDHNIGSGPSRNQGILSARGEYLSFVDPDDHISYDFLEKLYQLALSSDADIAKGTTCRTRIKDLKEIVFPPGTLNDSIHYCIKNNEPLYLSFSTEHCSAIYRRKMILENFAFYGNSCNAEDRVFLLRVCFACKRAVVSDEGTYYYVEREGSNDKIISVSRLKGEVVSFGEMIDFIQVHDIRTRECYEYLSKYLARLLEVQKVIGKNDALKEDADEVFGEICKIVSEPGISEGLSQSNMIAYALIKDNINLGVLPDERYWYQGDYKEYEEQVQTWIDYICKHRENCAQCQPWIWMVFETIIHFNRWSNKKERRDALRELRRQAKRLPDKRILTDNYISMNLFISYGINVFTLRNTKFGPKVRKVMSRIRHR